MEPNRPTNSKAASLHARQSPPSAARAREPRRRPNKVGSKERGRRHSAERAEAGERLPRLASGSDHRAYQHRHCAQHKPKPVDGYGLVLQVAEAEPFAMRSRLDGDMQLAVRP